MGVVWFSYSGCTDIDIWIIVISAFEAERSELIVKSAENQRQLAQIEDKILELLNAAQGMILDDEDLINTLQKSKVTSKQIEKRMEER